MKRHKYQNKPISQKPCCDIKHNMINNYIIPNMTDEKTQKSEQIDKPENLLQYLNTT